MTRRQRLIVAGGVVGAVLSLALLLAFASVSCPAEAAGQRCSAATANRVIVVALAALTVGLIVAPFAFLAEFGLRRQIVYRGAWLRAGRRGALVGATVAVLGALRLGGALSVPAGFFILTLAVVAEWFAVRRLDVT